MNGMRIVVYQTERMDLDNAFEYLGRLNAEEYGHNTLIVMPEKWIKDLIDMDSPEYVKLISILESISERSDCAIVPGSFSLKESGTVYNAAPMIYSGELQGWQKKISLFKMEKEAYAPGNEMELFDICGIKVGIAVCYDIDFPYYAKKLVSGGCDLIVNPSLIHSEFTDMWHLYIRARSLENRVPIVSVNSISDPFFGNSIVVDPYSFDFGSKIRDHMCERSQVSMFDINPEQTFQMRNDRIKEDPGKYDLSTDNGMISRKN